MTTVESLGHPGDHKACVADELGVALAEYEQIKQEQRQRIGFRDNLIYVALASMAAVGYVALQQPDLPMLLLVPPVTFVLGWNYLHADQKVAAIGRYVRTDLAARLAALVQAPVFGWELANYTDPRMPARKAMWLAVDLAIWVLAPLAAVGIAWVQTGPALLLWCASPIEVAGVAVLAYQIIRPAARKDEEGGQT